MRRRVASAALTLALVAAPLLLGSAAATAEVPGSAGAGSSGAPGSPDAPGSPGSSDAPDAPSPGTTAPEADPQDPAAEPAAEPETPNPAAPEAAAPDPAAPEPAAADATATDPATEPALAAGPTASPVAGAVTAPAIVVDNMLDQYVVQQGNALTLTGTMAEGAFMTASMTAPGSDVRVYWTCSNVGTAWTCTVQTSTETFAGQYTLNLLEIIGVSDGDQLNAVHVVVQPAEGAGGGAVLDCAYTPGQVSVSTTTVDTSVQVQLYSVAVGDGYTPQRLGDCSGPGTSWVGPFDDVLVSTCEMSATSPPCVFDLSDLAPGVWNLYYRAGEGGSSDYFFTVPESPADLAATSVAGGISFGGTAVDGNTVTVVGEDDATVCSATVSAGAWSCTATAGESVRGYRATQTDASSGGVSLYSPTVTAAGGPPAAPPVTPPAAPVAAPVVFTPVVVTPVAVTPTTPEPLVFTVSVGGITGGVRHGQSVQLSSTGLPPGSAVSAELHSTPVFLGATTVGADGSFSLAAVIPQDIEAGEHHFVVTVTPPGGTASVSETAVTVDADATLVEPPAAVPLTTSTAPTVKSHPVAAALPRTDPTAPNSISTSITPLLEVLSSPVAIGSSVIAGLAFLVLVAFPSELLSAAIKDRYAFQSRKRRSANTPWRALSAWFGRRPVLAGISLVAAATLVTGFADPRFGADVASVRLLLACFFAALVMSYGTYALTNRFMNRVWSLPTSITLRPFTLVLTIVGVVLSRVLDFSPGFLFGLMLGLSFPSGTSIALRSHARLLRTCVIVGIAVAAWIGYSVMVGLTNGEPSGFGAALLQDTLAALSTEGLTGMLIAMLPFLYLEGQDIWDHSKRAWSVSYALVVVVFFVIVAPKPDSWANLGEKYAPWAAVLGCYAAIAFAAYFGLRWYERRAQRTAVTEQSREPV